MLTDRWCVIRLVTKLPCFCYNWSVLSALVSHLFFIVYALELSPADMYYSMHIHAHAARGHGHGHGHVRVRCDDGICAALRTLTFLLSVL